MRKAKDLRQETIEALEAELANTQKECFELVNAFKHLKKLEKPHLLREKRRDKARLLTVLTEKRQANQQTS